MATLRARVELRESLTHTHAGRTFVKGKPQILTNSADVKYYQETGGFSVTILEEPKEKVAVPAKPAVVEPAGPVVHSKSQLMKLNKEKLATLAADQFGLALDAGLSQKEMVDQILKAQEEDLAQDEADADE